MTIEHDSDVMPQTNVSEHIQTRIIGLSKKIAALAVHDLGSQIVEDYTGGLSKSEIVAQREIKERYGLTSDAVAARVVYEVICVLMDEETRQTIAREHLEAVGKRMGTVNGQIVYQEGKGLFGRSVEKRIEDARKGGPLGGQKIRDEKLGIFSYSTEQIRENSRKGTEAARRKKAGYFGMTLEERRAAGHLATATRGQFVWDDTEIARLVELANNPDYKTRRGAIHYKKVAERLNQEFNRKRTGDAIQSRWLMLKNAQGGKKEPKQKRRPLRAPYKDLGDIIVSKLGERSRDWLAQQVGVTVPTIYYWVTGKKRPSPSRLGLIASVLGLSKQELEVVTLLSQYSRYDEKDDKRHYEKVIRAYEEAR